MQTILIIILAFSMSFAFAGENELVQNNERSVQSDDKLEKVLTTTSEGRKSISVKNYQSDSNTYIYDANGSCQVSCHVILKYVS